MIYDLVTGSVEGVGKNLLRERESDSIAETLPQRTGSSLNSGGQSVLGVSRSFAVPLTEALDLVDGQSISGQVEHRVEEHRCMTRRKYDAIPVGPIGCPGSVLQRMLPKGVRGWGQAHRCAGMSAVGFLHSIDRQEADGINRPPRCITVDGGFGDSLGV